MWRVKQNRIHETSCEAGTWSGGRSTGRWCIRGGFWWPGMSGVNRGMVEVESLRAMVGRGW